MIFWEIKMRLMLVGKKGFVCYCKRTESQSFSSFHTAVTCELRWLVRVKCYQCTEYSYKWKILDLRLLYAVRTRFRMLKSSGKTSFAPFCIYILWTITHSHARNNWQNEMLIIQFALLCVVSRLGQAGYLAKYTRFYKLINYHGLVLFVCVN